MDEVKEYNHHLKDYQWIEDPAPEYAIVSLDPSIQYTYADYLTWMDDVRRELIGGFVHLMSAPTEIHARLSYAASWVIESFIRKKKRRCRIYHAPFDVRLPINGEKADNQIYNVVQPDICVVCDLSKLDKRGCIGAPDLIVEVLSPSTLKKDWNYKFNLYEKAGVREYWIVDPIAKAVNAFILQSDGNYDHGTVYTRKQSAPVFIFEGLEIELQELFEE
ncbi:MAG: Uma2 family endonuclease [Prevotellaceae bacterium]|jgi:Uma2 family endonuclease|nr:Uma2 family endonuclease [Prevotellaceae bacterium]